MVILLKTFTILFIRIEKENLNEKKKMSETFLQCTFINANSYEKTFLLKKRCFHITFLSLQFLQTPHSFIFLTSPYIFTECDFWNTLAKLYVKCIFMLTIPCKLGCSVINILLLTQILSDSAGFISYESWFSE